MAAADPNKSGAGGDSNNPQVETSFDDADPIRDLNANQKVKDMLQQCDKWHQSRIFIGGMMINSSGTSSSTLFAKRGAGAAPLFHENRSIFSTCSVLVLPRRSPVL